LIGVIRRKEWKQDFGGKKNTVQVRKKRKDTTEDNLK
jgi:hypothetical protein